MTAAGAGGRRGSTFPQRHARRVRTTTRFGLRAAEVAGVPVVVTSPAEATEWLLGRAVRNRMPVGVRLVNAYSIVAAHEDAAYLRLMREHGVSLPDGTPVAAAQILQAGERGARRVRGPSFFVQVLARSAGTGVRHFVVGTTPATLEALRQRIEERWPGVEVAGTYAPPFGAVTDALVEECRVRIEATAADLVWVALGTPKQDFMTERLASALQRPCVAVGAAVDFLAGTKPEAPRFVQRVGAEWAYRLVSEPRRLWRRYLIGNLVFLRLLLRSHGGDGR